MTERLPRHEFFVNFINGRCGSTLLTTYLNQVPDVICYPEVLAALDREAQARLLGELIRGGRIEEINPIAASDVYYPTVPVAQKDTRELVAVGMKTKYGDIADLPAFMELARAHRFKILFMTRANLLKTVLSRLRAGKFYEKYGDYNVTAADQKVEPIHVDLDQFATMLTKEQRYVDDLNAIVGTCGRPVLSVAYEDLVANPVSTMNRVLMFLKSSYWTMPHHDGRIRLMGIGGETVLAPMVTKIFKMTKDRISEEIINYEEFHKRFAETPYARFLDDVRAVNA